MAWAILGQASGAYVGPTCWAVMFLAGAATILHERKETPPRGRVRQRHATRGRQRQRTEAVEALQDFGAEHIEVCR